MMSDQLPIKSSRQMSVQRIFLRSKSGEIDKVLLFGLQFTLYIRLYVLKLVFFLQGNFLQFSNVRQCLDWDLDYGCNFGFALSIVNNFFNCESENFRVVI
eukprot:TRINITY_DN1985_c0_g1_i1.p4 TRINITY_DN1985_c0_g1~~TRINITY_DN1985_c0_g1_i1.p4  ORF type:complete len:100 (-),score=0.18 TRINITY_DN1985_c0_g1_i1:76-375(-)